jgi:hypothetical protein
VIVCFKTTTIVITTTIINEQNSAYGPTPSQFGTANEQYDTVDDVVYSSARHLPPNQYDGVDDVLVV